MDINQQTKDIWTIGHSTHSLDEFVTMLKYFNEKEIVALTMPIVAINGRNRLAIGFRTVSGSYDSK